MKLFFTLLAIPLIIPAMEKSHEQQYTFTISPGCQKALQEIDADANTLAEYIQNMFDALPLQVKQDANPSTILSFIAAKPPINSNACFYHRTASSYIEQIIKPYAKELDQEFLNQLQITQDKTATWQWFWKDYFDQVGIIKPLTAYKKELARANQKRLLAMGITAPDSDANPECKTQ